MPYLFYIGAGYAQSAGHDNRAPVMLNPPAMATGRRF